MPSKSRRAKSPTTKTKKTHTRSARPKSASRRQKPAKATSKRRAAARVRSSRGFPQALATLLKSRRLKVPKGLLTAPREAYAAQPAEFVDTLARLDDAELLAHASRVATYGERRAERAKASWDGSPLITEIRRRKLKEPPRPKKVAALAFSLKRPLAEWSNAELLLAAREWSRRGR